MGKITENMSSPTRLSDEAVESLVSSIISRAPTETIKTFLADGRYSKYQDDPVGFCEQVLGETLTDDLKVMLE